MYMIINFRNYDILPTVSSKYDPFTTTSNFLSVNNKIDKL